MLEALIAFDEVRRWANRTFEPDESAARESRSGRGTRKEGERLDRSAPERRSPEGPRSRITLLQRVLARDW
jgi:hypothetical protein